MRQASKDYQKYKLSIARSDSSHLTLTEGNTSKEQVKDDVEDKLKEDEGSMRDSKDQQDDSAKNPGDLDLIRDTQKETETKDIPTVGNTAPKEEKGLLHYFYLTKLIALLDIWQFNLIVWFWLVDTLTWIPHGRNNKSAIGI